MNRLVANYLNPTYICYMHKLAATLLVWWLQYTILIAQQPYWQQQVDYNISVQLNDVQHSLKAVSVMHYTNNSPDTLTYLWMHVYMNAYKDDRTAFCEQLIQQGNTKFYFGKEEDRGYTNQLNFTANNKSLTIEDHPNYIDIIKVLLNEPLLPKQSITITTPFHVQLPYNYSRGGHVGQAYQITQWYPKPAVYDAEGWHPMPYLDQGEFYSEFGNYTVTITLPSNYVVAATGVLQQADEVAYLNGQNKYNKSLENKVFTKSNKSKIKSTKNTIKDTPQPPSSATTKTLTFKQDSVIDFAWFADKRWHILQDTVQLPNGNIVACQSYYLPHHKQAWATSISTIKNTLRTTSKQLGNYPYQVCTAIDAVSGISGGMEYPTITCISNEYNSPVDGTIIHEVRHNWLQGILANNERDYPWLDEGLNTYYDYFAYKQRDSIVPFKKIKIALTPFPYRQLKYYDILHIVGLAQPIATSSQAFSVMNYNDVAYNKTGEWVYLLKQKIGAKAFDSGMLQYYNTWKFKHPQPHNFDSTWVAYPVYKDSILPLRYTTAPMNYKLPHNQLYIQPAVGINRYDGLQLGTLIHNYAPTTTPLRYILAPLYATSSNQLNGIARLAYNIYPKQGKVGRIDVGTTYSKFTKDAFEDINGKLNLGFRKIVPFIRITAKPKNALDPVEKFIQFKHYNIRENNLTFNTVIVPPDTVLQAGKISHTYTVNQLQLVIQKLSKLYPYKVLLQVEHINEIIRSTITAEQYFNYNSTEGVRLRFFAGKVIYLRPKTLPLQFKYDRYALNLLAPKGVEDYTYSTYFYARNAFDQFPSSQILQRDGFFKFRTDLLISKAGRTNNWLASVNLNGDIPAAINPLAKLPFKLPIQFFLDVGTYAEAWQKNSGNVKFLYDAGIQLTLLKGLAKVYLPLIYSKQFATYSLQLNGKKRTLKNISFSIDMPHLTVPKVLANAL